MRNIDKLLLKQFNAANEQFSTRAANTVDWLFKRDTLIKSGRTWFELVHDSDLMTVRYYELPDDDKIRLADGSTKKVERKRYRMPLVLVPPIGVPTDTFDLLPQRSLVRYMVAHGFKVYLIDWGKPTKKHAHLGMKDYSYDMMGAALSAVREHSGERDISAMGWCMGGLFTLFYQGMVEDKHLRNIITVASPFDMASGAGVFAQAAQVLGGPLHLVGNYAKLHNISFKSEHFSFPPWLSKLMFKATNPVGSMTTYLDLVTRMADRQSLEDYSTTSDYMNNLQRFPGGVVREMGSSLLAENSLATGEVDVAGMPVRLNRIKTSLLVFAGKSDNLVAPEVARRSIDVTASKDADFRIAPGGHMGVFIGSRAQGSMWKDAAFWLSRRSGGKSI